MPLVTVDSTNTLKRYEFTGTALPTEWNILEQGSGQTVSVASSIMTIAAGTTSSAQTIVRCTQRIRVKTYIRFIMQLSQRIANQNIFLELINEAGTTFAQYDFNGTTATSVQCRTGNQGTNNTATAATVPTTANYATFDIYADTNDVVFSSVAANSNAVKSGIVTFDRNILDPNEDYFVQIRVLNGATAPASNTNVNIDAVVLQDLTGVKVDIIRGDGTAALANTQPVNVLAMPTTTVTGTVSVNALPAGTNTIGGVFSANNVFWNDSVTAQAASATFTGTSRDVAVAAGTVHRYSAFNAVAFADQAGTLRIEMSNDNTTWRRATPDTSVAANSPVTLSVPVCTRHYRVVYVNGGVAQTVFMLNSSFTAA